jgi:hypothetical protein
MNISNLFPSRYLRAVDLNGKTVTYTIKEFRKFDVQDESKPGVLLQETEKIFILNKTNLKFLGNIYSNETDIWIGKKITLYTSKTQYQGNEYDCIRIRKPDLPSSSGIPV